MEDNKKTLMLSIVGVLVLIMVVVGVSYAMYTFAGTGTKENVITTGSISIILDPEDDSTYMDGATEVTVDNNTINLTNEYPKTDTEGLNNEAIRFYVASTMSGATTVRYEIGMAKETSTLEDGEVKVNLNKTTGGDNGYKKGTATTGALVSTFASAAGTLSGTTINGYLLDSGTFTGSGIATYLMKIWVDENYVLEEDTAQAVDANGVHTKATKSENYAFKIKAYATQVVPAAA